MTPTFTSLFAPPASITGPSRWFVFCGSRLLVRQDKQAGWAELPVNDDLSEIGLTPLRTQYLGTYGDQNCYSAEVDRGTSPPEGMSFHGLRGLYNDLPDDLFWLAGRAVQIVAWDRDHQFCGRCATPTEFDVSDRSRRCPNCKLTFYPRISPAVIMSIVKGDQLLLARSGRHPAGFYSVLAGFVEPGETLEQCVAREVKEEVGLEVKNIQYFGSQPWPFPNSLMLAFTCDYAGGEITLEDDEIAEADWYSADRMPTTPPSISIAAALISAFKEKQAAA